MTKILLVEDDRWYAEQQLRILQTAGYDAYCVNDAQAAVDAVEKYKPGAIVLDLLLTYNTAFTLLHELQSYDETAEIPIVVYSTQVDILPSDMLKSYGIVEVLDKTTMQPKDTIRALRRVGI